MRILNSNRFFILLILTALAIGWSFYFEPRNVVVEHLTITSTRVNSACRPIRLVQLSDLHLKDLGAYERKIIRQVNALKPDLICVTGDYFEKAAVLENPHSSEFTRQLEAIRSFFAALQAEHGIYVVRGNHDFSNDKETSNRLLEILQKTGVHVLADQGRRIVVQGTTLWLAGIDFPEFPQKDRAVFTIQDDSLNQWLHSGASKRNSYAHLHRPEKEPEWRNYRFSGRFRRSAQATAIGVTFYSQMHRGFDRFYRLRTYAGRPTLHFSAHGTHLQETKDSDTGIVPQADRWYRFAIETENDSLATRVRARFWPADEPEPEGWQAKAIDTTSTRLSGGTIGVWSAKAGDHDFDDFLVTDNRGVIWKEDFGSAVGTWVSFNYHHQALPALFTRVPDSVFSVLLCHSPDQAVYTRGLNVDLVLSGHTHGGQVRLPGMGSIFVRIGLGRRYMEGFHDLGYTRLKVNRGIGTIHVPLRFFSRPEITLIELVPAD
ncbi:metallophosphoesterase [candidate division KSB1 bacterium]|nr:metallophosphoesterase [candidate division KSB1 bacterium]